LSSKIPKIGSNGGYPDSRSASISPELLGLVKRTAIHLKGRLPSNVDLDDLIQSGLEGLIQAIDSFDESRNTSLEQYSKTRIRGAMLDDVRRMSQTTRTTIMFKREHSAAIEKLTIRYGRQPSSKEVATYLGKDLETFEKERVVVAGADSVGTELNDDTQLPDDWFEDSPESELQRAELLSILKDSVATLPERTQLVFSLYYAEELNLKEIAAIIDVSESRVSQILSETAALLRKKVENRSDR